MSDQVNDVNEGRTLHYVDDQSGGSQLRTHKNEDRAGGYYGFNDDDDRPWWARSRVDDQSGGSQLRTHNKPRVQSGEVTGRSTVRLTGIKCIACSAAFSAGDFLEVAGLLVTVGCTVATAGVTLGFGVVACAAGPGAAGLALKGLVNQGIDKGERCTFSDDVQIEIDGENELTVGSMNSGDTKSVNLSIDFDPSKRLCVVDWDNFGNDELGCMLLSDLRGTSGSVDIYVSEKDMGSMYMLTFQV